MQNRQFAFKNSALLAARAAGHRKNPSPSEAALFRAISAGKLGVSFRRQVPLGGKYIVDFFAPAVGLAVEVDGRWHRDRARADERRDRVLRRLGYRVLRLEAELVLGNLERALAQIRAALAER